MSDKTVTDAMEADVRRMAGQLRPTVAAAPTPMPSTRDTVTVGKLRSALDVLTANASQAEHHARQIAWQLAGGEEPKQPHPTQAPDRTGDAPAPVFQALAFQVVQVSRALERLETELKKIDGALA